MFEQMLDAMEAAGTTETTRTFWWNTFEDYKPINTGWFRSLAFSITWYAMQLAMITILVLGLYQVYQIIRMAIQ
jgi:hypothetical protein